MKRLDKLVIKSFVGPFVVTFGIAMFVLLMQILWVYIDEIAGKGLSFFLVMELMAYKCVGLVPLALPLALLISSVMVMGGMAEHYELSSFKSAGVSLLRLMRPLIVFSVLCAGLSYACADYIIPAANLQFGSRMYDIQNKKPTMSMEVGVFNEDFSNFAIRLGNKSDNGRDIEDVLIYDHSKAATGLLSQITAERGEMFSIENGDLFVMRLYDGHQYNEQRPRRTKSGMNSVYTRTDFEVYTKVFDMSEFEIRRHKSTLFQTNRAMLPTWALALGVDSINTDLKVRRQSVSNHAVNYVPFIRTDTTVHREQKNDQAELHAEYRSIQDSVSVALTRPTNIVLDEEQRPVRAELYDEKEVAERRQDLAARQRERKAEALAAPLVVDVTDNFQDIRSLLANVKPDAQQRSFRKALSASASMVSQAANTIRLLPGIFETRAKFFYDLHSKYSMALVCIIFIFIGAPMGAIVRKGGFGYPILVSIIFFVIFIIMTIFCRKLAESFVVSGSLAGWLPCIILFPVSLYITLRAMKDAKLVSTDGIATALGKTKSRLQGWRSARRTSVTPLDQ